MTIKKSATKRWGKGIRADSQSARELILDAALSCYKSEGIIKTTVEHVAGEAMVSRTTVYRYFKNRDEILTGVVFREAIQVLGEMQKTLEGVDELAEFLVEGMVFCLQMAPKMPLHRFAFGVEGAALTNRLCFSSEDLLALGDDIIEPYYARGLERGEIPAEMEKSQIIEWLARILLSFITTSSITAKTEEQQRELFKMFLAPVFKQQK